MTSKIELDKLLELLEDQIKIMRREIKNGTLGFEEGFKKLQELLDRFVSILGLDTELENKRRIYGHVANFLSKRFNKDINICTEATYILCKEDDPRLLSKGFPSDQAERIALTAKEHILAIKVFYDWIEQAQKCDCKTEIFSHKPSGGKPLITRIEEELNWDNLPSDVRATFIRNNKKDSIGFELYP